MVAHLREIREKIVLLEVERARHHLRSPDPALALVSGSPRPGPERSGWDAVRSRRCCEKGQLGLGRQQFEGRALVRRAFPARMETGPALGR